MLIMSVTIGAGLFIVLSPSILVFDDPGAIVMGASISSAFVAQNQTVVVRVWETNNLYFNNSISLSSDWRIQNLSMRPCNSLGQLFGIAVYQGRYTLDNVSSASQLSIYPPGEIYDCPNAEVFYTRLELGPRQTLNDSVRFSGYMTSGFTPNPGGGETEGYFVNSSRGYTPWPPVTSGLTSCCIASA